ncbi:hypothetical protein ACQYWY_06980 [Comamonas sediminis]|uniref:hypothetical protein n=1 Tax=Comamonas sediminis TaxID=1783360 RepID=UPI003D2806B1
MTSEKLKPTPGPWYYNSVDEWDHSVVTQHGETDDGSTRLWTVASANTVRDEKEDNARLIAEAGTVHHECGLSPRQLMERCKELASHLEALVGYDYHSTEYDGCMYEICPSCGAQDKPHTTSCEFTAARAALAMCKAE